ncbi:MAG TPA: hypothetical protein VFI15_08615 [Candidatus Limnocylindrales bacterium]|nr:hypothetical protein [Candidatus Limnocylindrales bacterium]
MTQGRLVAILAIAIGLVAIAITPPDARELVIRATIVVAGVWATASLLRRSRLATASVPGRFESFLERPASPSSELPGLRPIDVALRMSMAHALGVEILLRGLVRDLARWRLRQHRGIDLDTDPARARAATGETIWQLIASESSRTTGPSPLSAGAVTAIIDDLERIA